MQHATEFRFEWKLSITMLGHQAIWTLVFSESTEMAELLRLVGSHHLVVTGYRITLCANNLTQISSTLFNRSIRPMELIMFNAQKYKHTVVSNQIN